MSDQSHASKSSSTAIQPSTASWRDNNADHDFFNNAMEGIFRSLPGGRYSEVNPAMARMYGYASPAEMIANISDIGRQVHADQKLHHLFEQQLKQHGRVEKFEAPGLRKDGTVFWTSTNARAVSNTQGDLLYYEGFVQDITERKLAEAALQESEQLNKLITDMTTDYLFIVDVSEQGELHLRWASENMEEQTGRSIEKASSRKLWKDIIHPDDYQAFSKFIDQVLASAQPGEIECQVISPLATRRWIHIFVRPQVDEQDHVRMIVGAVKDITSRKQAEEALRSSEQKMHSIFQVAPTGIGVVIDRVIAEVNPKICEMTGYSRDELVGKSTRILYPNQEEYGQAGRDNFHQLTKKGTGRLETIWRRKDGTMINVLLASTPVDNDDLSRGIIFTALDITERKRSEGAMRAVAEVSRDISATLQLDVVLERIAAFAKSLLDADSSAVYLVENGTTLLHTIAAVGEDAEQIKKDPVQPGEGILGNIAVQKSGEIVNDTHMDPRGIEIKGTASIPSEHLMGVPVMLKERLTGLIAVWRDGEGQDFKSPDLDLLTGLAQQVAVAIENARLFNETQRRLREMEALVRVSATLSRTLELESLLEEILQTVIQAIPASERGSILLADDEKNLHIRAVWGYKDPRVRSYRFPPNAGYSMKCFRQETPIIVPDVRADTSIRYDGDIREMRFEGSAIASPLIVKNTVIGVITIDTPRQMDAFNQNDLQLLTAMAASAALAIENARLFDETRQRLADLEILHTISSALRTAANLDEAMPILLTQLMNLLDAEASTLEMVDPLSGEIVTQLALGEWSSLTGMRTPREAGISGRVISTGESYLSSDVVADGVTDRPDLFAELKCVACVPVISQHSPIGALWIGRRTRIREEVVSLLGAVGELVGNAIHRMVLHEQTELRLNRLNALHMIERVINSSLDLNITLEILLEHVVTQLHASAAAILLLNPRMFTLEYIATKGLRSERTRSTLRLGDDATSRAILERTTISLTDLSAKRPEYARLASLVVDEGIQSYHATPLIAKGQVRGVLEVFHREQHHPESEWESFLQSLAEEAAIAVDNAELFKNLQRSNEELSLAYDDTITGWARALDLREKETADHSYRVSEITLLLARRMGVDESQLQHIRRGALLHDIGKVGIPDAILLKKDQLTADEWQMMKKHPVFSYELLRSISYLLPAVDIPHYHHEKWDGTGYPQGLSREEIPLSARIFAVVDVWDALRSERPYRSAWPNDAVLDYLRTHSGTHFDPAVVAAFLAIIEDNPPEWIQK